jgi:multicomponent Na+:H+ antiporter subunit D
MNVTALTIMPVAVFLAAAYATPIVHRWHRRFLAPVVLAAGASGLGLVAWLCYRVAVDGPQRYHLGGWPPPWGIEVLVDRWAAVGLLTVTGVALPVLLYALRDAERELHERVVGRYFALVLVLCAAMLGVVMANDVFNLFVFVEISSLAACGIIAVKGDRIAIEASLRYLILGALGSGAMLMSVALLYMVTGHLNMEFLGSELMAAVLTYPKVVYAGLGFALLGLSIKAALFPLHVWLPDAHASAPTASSALLSGLVVKVYIFGLWRLFDVVFGPGLLAAVPVRALLLGLGTLGIFGGSIIAIGQEDLKRMLAYSTVANIGYVFLGLGLNTERALVGAALHIIFHALMKSSLFLAAGSIIHATGTRHVRRLAGVGTRMPFTMGAFTVGALAMVGFPPLNGFVSKWYLALGALDAGQPVFVAVILVSSLLNGLYYLPIVIAAFFRQEQRPRPDVADPAWPLLGPTVVLAGACVATGVLPSLLLALLGR